MPDNKLTDVPENNVGKISDNEIIKALECCAKARTNFDCKKLKCPFFNDAIDICGVLNSEQVLIANALNLINRLQADKQSLKYDYDNLQRQFDEIYQQFHYLSNVEIPYLYSFTEDKDKKLETIANILLRTKSEAYKEFAEKAEHKILSMLTTATLVEKDTICFCLDKIKNLLKELVGDSK